MRTLHLHVGATKTGTSALQFFFENNRDWLGEQGIAYPQGPHRPDSITMISSGNGGWLHDCMKRGGSWQEFSDQLSAGGATGDILLSSESFSFAAPDGVRAARDFLSSKGFEMRPFFLVRNPDEWFISAYQQHVKRQAYFRSYEDFCGDLPEGVVRGANWRLGFEATIENYESVLGDGSVRVLSYEAAKPDIVRYVALRALGISADLPAFENRQVNRSLTPLELEVLRSVNRHLSARGLAGGAIAERGTRMSDDLIGYQLELDSQDRYVAPMPAEVVQRLRPAVERINRRLDHGFIDFAITDRSQSLDAAQKEAARLIALNLLRLDEMRERYEQLAGQVQSNIVARERELAEAVSPLAAEIRHMHESRSWRITAPLRAISSAIRSETGASR